MKGATAISVLLLFPLVVQVGCAKGDRERKLDMLENNKEFARFIEQGKTPYARWLKRQLANPDPASEGWDLWQLTFSANHLEKQEVPPVQARANLRLVARKLEQIERLCAPTVWVHSGYRSPTVNNGVGGVRHSRHMEGLAADLSFPGSEASAVKKCICKRARAGICEMYVHKDRHYIHMGLCRYLEKPGPLKWCGEK
ncbi:MAG: DUF882 domain-containing protein [Deltaproteobacteria bacterium]|nr:DUF882 domain-containing protein [Deltaproteobacteria bacterium]